jgi:hypothetical protein
MDTEVTLTQCKLLSLSPEVCSQVCEATSARRALPNRDHNINILAKDVQLSTALDDIEEDGDDSSSDQPPATFLNVKGEQITLPPGAIIIPDPYETYLKSLPRGAVPKQLVIAKESSALRSIFPLIDNQQDVESIKVILVRKSSQCQNTSALTSVSSMILP